MNRVLTLAVAGILVMAGILAWKFLEAGAKPGVKPLADGTPSVAPKNLETVSLPPPSSRPAAPPASPPTSDSRKTEVPSGPVGGGVVKPPYVSLISDRIPDEILPDGTQVFHNYPMELRQPDGSMKTVGVTISGTPLSTSDVPVRERSESSPTGK